MSSESALVERMSNAVRSAYKAMEILKEENRVLKLENEELKRQLQLAAGTSGHAGTRNHVQITQTMSSPNRISTAVVPNNDRASVASETSKISEINLDTIAKESTPSTLKIDASRDSNIHDKIPASSTKPNLASIQSPGITPISVQQDKVKQVQRTVLPITGNLELIPMKEENGQAKFTHKKFILTPDATRFVQHLKELRYSNLHYIAHTLVNHSMLTLCKAIMLTISSYITEENNQEWNEFIQSALSISTDLETPPPLLTIHVSILKQLDLLVAMIVSMASRGRNGVIHTQQLLEILKKVIFGSVRCQLVSAQYAVVMGTTRVGRVPPVLHHMKSNSSCSSSGNSNTVKSTSQQSPINKTTLSCPESEERKENVDKHIVLEQQEEGKTPIVVAEGAEKSEFKAALASMFGIDSDSDDDRSGAEEVHWGGSSRDAATTTTTSSAAVVSIVDRDDDTTRHHSVEEEEVEYSEDELNSGNNSSDDSDNNSNSDSEGSVRSTGSGRMEVDHEVTVDKAQEQEELGDTAQRTAGTIVNQHLEMACRVYALITPLLRLRLYDALVEVLAELSLVTAGNMCLGCVAGLVSIFGSARYSAVLKVSKIRKQLCDLVRTWLWTAPEAGETEVESSFHSITTPTLQRFWRYLTATTDESLPRELKMMEPDTEKLAVALHQAVTSSTTVVDSVLVGHLCRRLGFWGSVSVLCPVQSPPLALSRVSLASDPFSVLGMDKFPRYSQEWSNILSWWDPARNWWDPARKESDPSKEEAPSLAQFLQSDDYFLSEVQSEVLASLRAAGIHTMKYIDQEQLVLNFAKKWSIIFSQDTHVQVPAQGTSSSSYIKQTIKAIVTMRILYQSFLHTEYENGEGGWRTGLSGDGFRLASRLDNRLTVGVALLRKIPFAQYFIASGLGAVLKSPLKWLHYSSCNGRKLLEYAEFVDHCERHVLRDYASTTLEVGEGGQPSSGGSSTEADKTTAMIIAKLRVVCTDITTLLSLESLEAAMSVSASSVRGLLHALYSHTYRDSYTLQEDHIELLYAAKSFLRVLPAPWSGICRADILCEQQRCWYALSKTPTVSTVSSGASASLAEETAAAGRSGSSDHALRMHLAGCAPQSAAATCSAMPVFLINLDKRTDRYRRSLILLNQANLSVIRVRAWDGTTEQTAGSAAEMFQRNFTSSSGWNDTTITNTVPVKIEDLYSDIPEADVQLTWDSTLNAKFDARCTANTAVIATPSERACAASHLRVWRTIAEICGIKTASKSILRQSALARAASAGSTELGSSSGSTGVGCDSLIPSLVEQYKSVTGRDNDKTTTSTGSSTTAFSEGSAQNSSAALLALEKELKGRSETEYFVIFEDDVNFPQQKLVDLRATIRDLMATVPRNTDIVYLGGMLPKGSADFKLVHRKNESFYGVNYVWTLQAYVLRRRAVEVLLSKLPITAPVDNFIAGLIYNKELKACIAKDKLTQQLYTLIPGRGRRIDSDIRPSGRSYESSQKRPRSDITTNNSIEKKGKGKGSKKGKR